MKNIILIAFLSLMLNSCSSEFEDTCPQASIVFSNKTNVTIYLSVIGVGGNGSSKTLPPGEDLTITVTPYSNVSYSGISGNRVWSGQNLTIEECEIFTVSLT